MIGSIAFSYSILLFLVFTTSALECFFGGAMLSWKTKETAKEYITKVQPGWGDLCRIGFAIDFFFV